MVDNRDQGRLGSIRAVSDHGRQHPLRRLLTTITADDILFGRLLRWTVMRRGDATRCALMFPHVTAAYELLLLSGLASTSAAVVVTPTATPKWSFPSATPA